MREFLERDVMAATEGRVQFHTRVAVNVLNIVARELELDDTFAETHAGRAAALLGHDGDVDDLERELAAAHRSERQVDRTELKVRAHVRATVQSHANPGYLPNGYCGSPALDRPCNMPGRASGSAPRRTPAPHADRHLERQLAEGPAPRVEEFLGYADVDVLCLQETKLADKTFPALTFQGLGYESVHNGQGQWNGVAILSRVGIANVTNGFGDAHVDPYEGDARIVAADCGGIRCRQCVRAERARGPVGVLRPQARVAQTLAAG